MPYLLDTEQELPFLQHFLNSFTDYASIISENHLQNEPLSTLDLDARTNFRLATKRTISFGALINGFIYHNEIDKSTKTISDPFSNFVLTRSILESFCNFNNIYVQSRDDDEKRLKHDLWVICALKNRQMFQAEKEIYKEKKLEEKEEIELLNQSIFNNAAFLKLDEQSKDNIRNAVKQKKWQLIIRDKKAKIGHWQELLEIAGAKDNVNSHYPYLSLVTHPSKIATMQFFALERDNSETIIMKVATKMTLGIFGMYISDYASYFPKSIENLEGDEIRMIQDTIKENDIFFRNDK